MIKEQTSVDHPSHVLATVHPCLHVIAPETALNDTNMAGLWLLLCTFVDEMGQAMSKDNEAK